MALHLPAKHRSRAALAVAMAAGLATGAPSAARAEPPQLQGNVVSEVVVRAQRGPALWRVAKGRSELVILGAIEPTPEGAAWNTRPVADALRGARVLLLSPGSTPGFAWADNFPDSRRYLLGQPFGRTLARELAPAAGARFAQMTAAIRQPSSRYSGYRPGPAGMILLEDSWRARQLTGSALENTVIGLARSAHVRVVKVDEGGALPLLDAMPSMSRAQHAACIGEAMDQFDWEGSHANAGFRAWANGDLAALQRAYRPVSLCLDSIPKGSGRRDEARAAWTRALEAALDAPGRTVAVMDVSDLLEPSALLSALEAQGAAVTRPPGEPAPGSRPPPISIARDMDPESPVELEKPGFESLRAGWAKPFEATPGPIRIENGSSRIVDMTGDDDICLDEASTGSLFLHKTCHSRLQWEELEKHRDLGRVQEMIHRKQPALDPQ